MDQRAIGTFIASLRRERGLTQGQLGARIGVTNKTVSRWETGAYLPDVEMLQVLGAELGASVDELLAGKRLTSADSRQQAGESVPQVARERSFSRADDIAFFKRKWRHDHAWLLAALGLAVAACAVAPIALGRPWLACATPLAALAAHCFQNNRMMAYVESHVYG